MVGQSVENKKEKNERKKFYKVQVKQNVYVYQMNAFYTYSKWV